MIEEIATILYEEGIYRANEDRRFEIATAILSSGLLEEQLKPLDIDSAWKFFTDDDRNDMTFQDKLKIFCETFGLCDVKLPEKKECLHGMEDYCGCTEYNQALADVIKLNPQGGE